MWVVWRIWEGLEERTDQTRGNSEEVGGPELAVQTLEYQGKDLGLDVVVSSGELL